MTDRSILDLWVGLFVAAGLGALVFLALSVSNPASLRRDQGLTVTAHFSNIGGLKANAPVKSSGVVVGRVTDIRFDNKRYEAAVKMRLYEGHSFSKDTSAQILTSGLLGEQYVALAEGSEKATLQDGGRIILTSPALVLEQLIGELLISKAGEPASSTVKEEPKPER